RFSTEEVPPLLPQTWFDTHFTNLTARLPPTTVWTTHHLRRAASLKLAEMTAGGTWVECAQTPGMRRRSASRTLAVLGQRHDGTWPPLLLIPWGVELMLSLPGVRGSGAAREHALTAARCLTSGRGSYKRAGVPPWPLKPVVVVI
ncbi:hypothetical protein, partial [Kitasatospora nipponensis]|uniref:hypothetical protein n=1 Tax=Kitasatospora nipponensis TaxID=258049 RepID=UPI0031DC5E6B